MNGLVIGQGDAQVTMTSLELVEFVNEFRAEQARLEGAAFPSKGYAKLEHSDFLKKVPEVLGAAVAGNFSGYYTASNGKANPLYTFPKREACLMAMSYSYEIQAVVFDRMTELEQKQAQPRELTKLEILQAALESEQRRIEVEKERDHAIATKAEIGSRREATAMARASAAVREANRLRDELGRNSRHATVIAVEKAIGTKFAKNAYVGLRAWSKANGVGAVDVMDERYGSVKAWPAGAWLSVYDIDIGALFPYPLDAAA
ncbi:hypothetical protein [Stenotrophomonas acidaminiphila]|jgi:hypothetical protein